MVEQNGHRYVFRKNSNILLTCEHASKNIPQEYGMLGLTEDELNNSKDLYDPGSSEITRHLAERLGSSALYSDVSRLVIDCNRRLDAATKHENAYHSCPLKTELLVEREGCEDMIKIPQNIFDNQEEFDAEEKSRYEKYAAPYVNTAYNLIDQLRKNHEKTYIVQIHSFFPEYNGDKRNVDIGVLYDHAGEPAGRVAQCLSKNTDLHVAENRPWSIKDMDGVVFQEIEKMDDVEVIAFDVNNKHLETPGGVEKISDLILHAIRSELAVE